eukprot:CAMPEP_0180508556 /NCGR_PEP_ID=MMETSP1036_2-20121128/49237_1 /TAXON_ID=632150 /ORGANISM="Azadinium spinosum, Strain 3D9" /LENGTH=98 /DNA_ID=CAMNT_0022518875 /DNA_START=279 /DNA_END=575 /DNA_ORIENTATION=-
MLAAQESATATSSDRDIVEQLNPAPATSPAPAAPGAYCPIPFLGGTNRPCLHRDGVAPPDGHLSSSSSSSFMLLPFPGADASPAACTRPAACSVLAAA